MAGVYDVLVEQKLAIGACEEAGDEHGEVGVLGLAAVAVWQAIQQRFELADDLVVQRGDAAAELRAPERCGADLGEEDAAHPLRRHLQEEEVERAGERPFRIENLQLRLERVSQVVDDLIDGRDQERLFRLEVVVDQAGGDARRLGDALNRCALEAALHDRRAERVDDLRAARFRQARPAHK